MSTDTETPQNRTEQNFREVVYFKDRDQARTLTVEALTNAGFDVKTQEPPTIEDSSLPAKARDKLGTYSDREPEVMAHLQDPSGNTVEIGLSINPEGHLHWPFNWRGRVIAQRDDESIVLATQGNEDSSQTELQGSLMILLESAKYGDSIGTFHGREEGYEDWVEQTKAQLDPILGRES